MKESTMDKISVIVTVYNVASYLRTCLDSIINQTYHNLEIILVNDGSTDESLVICQQYQQKDSRIKIINQKNQGVSAARNAGLDAMTGKYFIFLDSDDWFATLDAIKDLHQLLIDNNAQIAVGNFNEFDEKLQGFRLYDHDRHATVFSTQEWFNYEYAGQKNLSQCFSTPWGKLFNCNVFHHLRFPLGKIDEDDLTMWRTYRLVDKVVFLDQDICIYRNNRATSITGVANPAQLFSLPAIEQRITMDRIINEPPNVEHNAYCWRLNAHFNHALSVGELSNYKHAANNIQIIQKYCN